MKILYSTREGIKNGASQKTCLCVINDFAACGEWACHRVVFPGNGLSAYIAIFKMTHSGIIYFPLDVQSRAG